MVIEGRSHLTLLLEDGGEGGALGHGQGREDQLLRDLIYILHAQDLHARFHYIKNKKKKTYQGRCWA